MIALNTYAGEWPDTDDHERTIVDSVLGSVPSMCPGQHSVLVKMLAKTLTGLVSGS